MNLRTAIAVLALSVWAVPSQGRADEMSKKEYFDGGTRANRATDPLQPGTIPGTERIDIPEEPPAPKQPEPNPPKSSTVPGGSGSGGSGLNGRAATGAKGGAARLPATGGTGGSGVSGTGAKGSGLTPAPAATKPGSAPLAPTDTRPLDGPAKPEAPVSPTKEPAPVTPR